METGLTSKYGLPFQIRYTLFFICLILNLSMGSGNFGKSDKNREKDRHEAYILKPIIDTVDPIIATVKSIIDKTTRPGAKKVREYANKIANTLASSENIDETIVLDRENEPFHIDITGWTVGKDIDGNKILCNPENDVIEYLDGPNRGLQYFTLASAKRETAKNGKQLIKTAKDCRVQIEKKYRPRTRIMFQETNQSNLENHDFFLENENIKFYGALNSKRKLGGGGDFSGFRCDDGMAFCIEKGMPSEQQNGKTVTAEKGCFYVQELPATRMFPVFCARENKE